jgi:threonine/homoserine/homoserine lactone efflux protein
MTAVAVIVIAAGAYLMWYAVRHTTAHPVTHAENQINSLAKGKAS